MFDITYGFLFFLLGITITICGFFIAYIVAWRAYENEHKPKRKSNPLDDLNRDMPGSKLGDDCQ
tara:strand:+ start:291 stop:482 length:192 start_codon:yes stop_codon:yes gene_type:complete